MRADFSKIKNNSSVLLTQYCSGDQIEKNEVGGTCGTYEESRGVYRVLVGKPERKNHREDPDIDGRITLRCMFRKWVVKSWIGSMWLRIGTGGGHL
jgi:hypothetical protein